MKLMNLTRVRVGRGELWLASIALIITALFLSSAATGINLWGSFLMLPTLPFRLFGSIPPMFLFIQGLAFDDSNTYGFIEAFCASLCALVALSFILAGLYDILKPKRSS